MAYYPTTDKGQMEYWADEALRSMRSAIANPNPGTIEDFALLDAVRFTRCAVGHAFKVRRDLRPPTLYRVGTLTVIYTRNHAT